jgi:hypothetical protein
VEGRYCDVISRYRGGSEEWHEKIGPGKPISVVRYEPGTSQIRRGYVAPEVRDSQQHCRHMGSVLLWLFELQHFVSFLFIETETLFSARKLRVISF